MSILGGVALVFSRAGYEELNMMIDDAGRVDPVEPGEIRRLSTGRDSRRPTGCYFAVKNL